MRHPTLSRLVKSSCLALGMCLLPLQQASATTAFWQLDGELLSALTGPAVDATPASLLVTATRVTSDIALEQHASVAIESAQAAETAPRMILTSLADTLRNIRYRRGGSSPDTGFDCSGFVRYVFRHAIGAELPTTSAAQFASGDSIKRDQLQRGDLVFFRTAGKRISHVGIYLEDGQFIHAPSSGKTVRVDRLDQSYWKQRFAGAKRPQALAQRQAEHDSTTG